MNRVEEKDKGELEGNKDTELGYNGGRKESGGVEGRSVTATLERKWNTRF